MVTEKRKERKKRLGRRGNTDTHGANMLNDFRKYHSCTPVGLAIFQIRGAEKKNGLFVQGSKVGRGRREWPQRNQESASDSIRPN